MIPLLKSSIPYVMLVGILALTLCTREVDQLSAQEKQEIETVDSLATELNTAVEAIEKDTDEAEQAIDELLDDI